VLAHLASLVVGSVGRQLWGLHWREEEALSLQQEEDSSLAKLPEKKDEGKKKKRILDLLRRYHNCIVLSSVPEPDL
jgi:hypothetical protein